MSALTDVATSATRLQEAGGALVILDADDAEGQSDWRYQEIMGCSSSAGRAGNAKKAGHRGSKRGHWREAELFGASAADDCEDWREQELLGASAQAASGSRTAVPRAAKAIRAPVAESCREHDDWRVMEVAACSASGEVFAGGAKRPDRDAARKGAAWREEELFGASAVCDSPIRSPAAAAAEEEAAFPPLDAQEGNRASLSGPPETGDVVLLGQGAPPEYRQCPGVVIRVAESHCTVIVLDQTRRLGVGECWPGFADVTIDCSSFRLGKRVVIDGLRSAKAKVLNGSAGTVSRHPSRGHPTFITKPSAPDRPQLTVCVALDEPPAGAEKSVMLETRFIVPYEDYAARTVGELTSALASLSVLSA